ncbi:MAG: HDOD domain-containing protein [Opitutaceae bacterium]|nr:HDOD domain-containing protein [Opitutaceae bacterium]
MSVPISDQELAQAVDQLPPVVSVIRRLLAVMRDPNSEVQDIARLMRADTALAAQTLRLANSPHYGLHERVGTVEEAIQHVGLNEILRLVTSLGARQVVSRDLPVYRISASLHWQHALAVAAAGEQVAGRYALNAEVVYLAGLLHTVGMVALNGIALARKLPPRAETQPLCDWERDQFGVENPEVAARVMRVWNFPEDLAGAVAARYVVPRRQTVGRPGAAVFLASLIAEKIPAGLPAEQGIFQLTTEQLIEIGLGGAGMSDLELSSLQLFSRVRAMLNLG